MPAVSNLLSEAHYIRTEDGTQNHTLAMYYVSTLNATNIPMLWLTCTTVQDHNWLCFRISSSTASYYYHMHWEATTRIQSDGNPPTGEWDW